MTITENAPKEAEGDPLSALSRLVATLRGENGCPWDRKQTPETMRVYLVEEAFELVEALDRGEPQAVAEELGDVLFLIFFLARLFEEKGEFDILDVARANAAKMIRRHPHVFGEEKAETAEAVRQRWFEFKQAKEDRKKDGDVLSSVPAGLPALLRAYRMCERLSRVGVSPFPGGHVLSGAEAGMRALRKAVDEGGGPAVPEALGELLFALAQASFNLSAHPDTALARALDRFTELYRSRENERPKAS